MAPGWLHDVSIAWIAACIVSATLICVHLIRHPQSMAIMDVVWPLTALYLGPLALVAYIVIGRASGKNRSLAQASFLGASHCGAGCALGDFIGEWLVYVSGFAIAGSVLWANYLVDFVLAYLFGIGFQFFSIAPMRCLGVRDGLIAAIKADTVSILAFEVGMFAWMAVSHELLFPRLEPIDATYWFMMQIAMMVGFITTLPANALLVRSGVKEAM